MKRIWQLLAVVMRTAKSEKQYDEFHDEGHPLCGDELERQALLKGLRRSIWRGAVITVSRKGTGLVSAVCGLRNSKANYVFDRPSARMLLSLQYLRVENSGLPRASNQVRGLHCESTFNDVTIYIAYHLSLHQRRQLQR